MIFRAFQPSCSSDPTTWVGWDCEKAHVRGVLDITFGVFLVGALIISTCLNPLVILIKWRERTSTAGRLYLALFSLYFLFCAARSPPMIMKAFDTDDKITDINVTSGQIFLTILIQYLVINQQFLILMVSATRMIKIYNPFQKIEGRHLLLLIVLYNCAMIYPITSKLLQDTRMYLAFIGIVVGYAPDGTGMSDMGDMSRFALFQGFTITALSLICSIITAMILGRSPNLTPDLRASKRRAVLVLALMCLTDLIFGVTYILLDQATKSVAQDNLELYFVMLFVCLVMGWVAICCINPIIILSVGYGSIDKIRKALPWGEKIIIQVPRREN